MVFVCCFNNQSINQFINEIGVWELVFGNWLLNFYFGFWGIGCFGILVFGLCFIKYFGLLIKLVFGNWFFITIFNLFGFWFMFYLFLYNQSINQFIISLPISHLPFPNQHCLNSFTDCLLKLLFIIWNRCFNYWFWEFGNWCLGIGY